MWTNGNGTNSVKPPVSRCSARVRSRWRAHDTGCSTAPNMIVTFERRPTEWAVRCASSHCFGVDLIRAQDRPDRIVEDLGGGARQRAKAGCFSRVRYSASGSPSRRAPSVTSSAVNPWMCSSGTFSATARAIRSYVSPSKLGWMPPCRQTSVAPAACASRARPTISSSVSRYGVPRRFRLSGPLANAQNWHLNVHRFV